MLAASNPSGWSYADHSTSMVISGNALVVTLNSAINAGIRGSVVKSSSKLYVEALPGTGFSSGANNGFGIALATADLPTVGNSANGAFMAFKSGTMYLNGSSAGITLGSFTDNVNYFCMAIDFANQRGWIRKDGGNWNANATYDPATNVGGVDISSIFPGAGAYLLGSFNASAALTLNIGGSAYSQTAPSGFGNWT